MIHDPKIQVTCDGEGCGENTEIEPDYVYHSYSGNSGQYACEDEAIEKKLKRDGWSVEGEDDESKHYCESCTEARAEEGK